MKKVISLIITIIFVLSVVSFIDYTFASANEVSENIYNETNTYNVDSIIENKQSISSDQVQYEKNQYCITYDMSRKIDRLVAEQVSVTVFTHG